MTRQANVLTSLGLDQGLLGQAGCFVLFVFYCFLRPCEHWFSALAVCWLHWIHLDGVHPGHWDFLKLPGDSNAH